MPIDGLHCIANRAALGTPGLAHGDGEQVDQVVGMGKADLSA